MANFRRITVDPGVMGGKPCIRGLRVTVATIIGLLASGRTRDEILQAYSYLELEDISDALSYSAWRLENDVEPDPVLAYSMSVASQVAKENPY
jgi:uncharacterized protein (DUF433 family)